MPKFEFCLPVTGKTVPAGPEWYHEIKFDGYRLRLERDGDRVRLITKGGYDWAKRYPRIVEAARKNRQSFSACSRLRLVKRISLFTKAASVVAKVCSLSRPGCPGQSVCNWRVVRW